ncbi:hypothetical protein [Neptunicella sp. SCSIO 80796]|uniref:hypothetical protein n=1 Tax=Neptunicella plasticusilytica TaxID=3117012 RepID=UPI003A4DE30A
MKLDIKRQIEQLFAVLLAMIAWTISGCQHHAAQHSDEIPIYVYHDFAPFIINGNKTTDLSRLLVSKLRQKTGLNWILHIVPRTLLNQKLARGEDVTILWANSKWFGGQPGLLASKSILWDADVIVYQPERAIIGQYPDAFKHKTFCGIEGHVYRHFSPLFVSGQMTRINGDNYNDCINKLLQHEADVVQMEKSQILNAYQQLIPDKIRQYSPNIDSFTRHMLLSPSYSHLLPQVNRVITQLSSDQEWQQDLAAFGERDFINLFDMKLEDLLKVHPLE